MDSAAAGTGMQPVAALLTIFALVFAAICWLRLVRVCFGQDTLLGIIAVLLPPLALLSLLPRWRQYRELLLLAAASLTCIIIATNL
ncbi:hypothetical protein [Microbulbifer hainanensis]|uniref:hypothetical protein n=1 Tax=Microbulbifer hainanensis TaxID=2735675 RepID=UPI001868825F|nr:hypothetical protein [Microbulbifer hainanensis]